MENENEETKETQENPGETQEPTNGVSTPEELEAIRAQLEEEQAALAEARAQLEQTMSEKDARIVALEAQLSQAQQAAESLRAEGVAISEANAQAIAKYLDAVKAANPAIPWTSSPAPPSRRSMLLSRRLSLSLLPLRPASRPRPKRLGYPREHQQGRISMSRGFLPGKKSSLEYSKNKEELANGFNTSRISQTY